MKRILIPGALVIGSLAVALVLSEIVLRAGMESRTRVEGDTESYAQILGVKNLFYPERRLTEFGERNGIEIIALAPEIQRQLGFGHWNREGHAVAAELLAPRLCAS